MSGDTLSVVLFFLGVAVAFFVQTLRPNEIRGVRIMMWAVVAGMVVAATLWPFLGVLFPAFAVSNFATSVVSLVLNAWAWFILLMVTLVVSSVLPTIGRRKLNPLKQLTDQQHHIASWLETIATEDSRDMGHRVHWEIGSRQTDSQLRVPEPYVDLSILLLNSSVYTLTLTEVTGRMTFRESPLQSPVEILNTRREIKHSEYCQLKMRQWLQPTTAQQILAAGEAEFRPGEVAACFTYHDQSGTTQPVRIAFSGAPFIVKG
jgi:membrane protein implicated in regulation of membrane protease activity